MTNAASPLFRALSKKRRHQQPELMELDEQPVPREGRRPDDFYATVEPDPIRALLHRDGDRIRRCGTVWEPACGDGALVREIRDFGLPCCASDLIDRGCPDSWVADYFTCLRSRGGAIITNPPFNLITARDGKGRWLKHSLEMPGWTYMALLLSWDWPAGRINGLGELLDTQPFAYCYVMRWKVDFTGEGQAPGRNAWFVWDREWDWSGGREPAFRFMDRVDWRQPELLGAAQ